jgi:conjugal transfer pilus assembly protein TraV
MLSKKLLLPAVLLTATTLTGCSSMMSIGESDYSCPGLPSGSLCQSLEENYMMTNGDKKEVSERIAPYNKGSVKEPQDSAEAEKPELVAKSEQIQYQAPLPMVEADSANSGFEIVNNPYVAKATPQLEKPKVHSVWFAPRIGSDGRFYGERNVYFAKGGIAWFNSEGYIPDEAGVELSKPKVFKPLQVVKNQRKASQSNGTQMTPNMQMPTGNNLFNR